MALFGGLKPKPFDPAMIGTVAAPASAPQVGALPGAQMLGAVQPSRPGFFDRGGFGQNWLGGTVDTLLQMRGLDPVYDPPEARRMRLLEAQRQADEQTARDRFVFEQEYKRANPTPATPYRWEANDGSLMELGPDGRPRKVYQDPTPRYYSNGDGTFTVVGGNGQDIPEPPQTPVGKLTPYGGPTRAGSGGFLP